mmetsp:Transcript_7553/g.8346  ORF Transcript_7553/g.8346 Transcript_7553/m.8346 type:complete len:189 (-) Transcript_7553:83-649(-)
MKNFTISFSFLILSLISVNAFVTTDGKIRLTQQRHYIDNTRLFSATTDEPFEIEITIPPKQSGVVARLRFPPVFSEPSELVAVRYGLPFGLNVEPQNNLATCTKDGLGGEKVGDVLRYTSQWTMGLPQGDGVVSTVASFSGGISWQCSMFDVMKAKDWSIVIEALTSNVESRTDEVLLIFERPLGNAN